MSGISCHVQCFPQSSRDDGPVCRMWWLDAAAGHSGSSLLAAPKFLSPGWALRVPGLHEGPRCTLGSRAARDTASQALLERYLESRLLVELSHITRITIGPNCIRDRGSTAPIARQPLPKPSPRPPAPTTGPKPHSFAGCQLPSAAAEPSLGGASRRRSPGGPGVPTAAPRSFIFFSSGSRTLPLFLFLTSHNHFRAVHLRLSSRQHPSLFPTTNTTTTTTTRSSFDFRIPLHHISGKHHGVSLCTLLRPCALDREMILSRPLGSSSLTGWPCLRSLGLHSHPRQTLPQTQDSEPVMLFLTHFPLGCWNCGQSRLSSCPL